MCLGYNICFTSAQSLTITHSDTMGLITDYGQEALAK